MRQMRGFNRLTRVDDALKIVFEHCGDRKPIVDNVSVNIACGSVLESDIVTEVNVPPFDRSAVDGYAVKAAETFSATMSNPAVFRLVGSLESGGAKGKIADGECFEIFTGAEIPRGADAVAMAEDCAREGNTIMVNKPVQKFANVSLRGEDLKQGEVVIKKGEILKPWHIGALASIGRKEVPVRVKPLVGVFSTGSELIDITGAVEEKSDHIYDSTRPMIISLLKGIGCLVSDAGIAKDEPGELENKLECLKNEADLIITIGGTSVGGKDLVPEAVQSVSKNGLLFHGLAVKPGKPAGFGMMGSTPLFMLPGYPVSALVGYEAIVQPLICRWLGIPVPERKKVRAIMARRVPTTPGVRHIVRVVLSMRDSKQVATPIAITGSGLLSSITKADGIVIVKEDLEGIEEGDDVEVELVRSWCQNA